ncbi:MAG: HipA domain-containing protein [Rikenellaceae bacterium]
MNKSCLYCFRELAQGEVDFHGECAVEFFGSATPQLSDAFSLKVADAESGYLPQVEAVALRMARSVMILTQVASLVPTAEGGVALARRGDLYAESLVELVERLDGCEFDGSLEMIAELIEDFSSIARLDVVNLFEQAIFGWVVGCNGISLASFSLSRPNAGVCSLAPIYDFVPHLDGTQEPFGLTINGKNRNIARRDFEAAMRHMGLKDRIIRITIEKITKAREQWAEIIDHSPLSEELKESFKRFVMRRIAILQKS